MPELKGQLWRPRPIDLGWADWGTLYGSLSNAALMLASEPEGLAIDFSDASISIKDLTTPANAIESQGTVSAGALVGPGAKIIYTSPSPKLCKKADGTYGYRAHNLNQRSNSFSSDWSSSDFTLTTSQSDPYGGNAATKLVTKNATSISSGLVQGTGATNMVAGTAHRIVIRCKEITGNAFPWMEITTTNPTTRSWVNLNTGATGTVNHTSVTPVSLDNGWWEFVVITPVMTGSSEFYFTPRPANSNSASVTGDGASGFYATRVQYGKFPCETDYIETTGAPRYDLPYDWTGTYYYPLCEPAATNLGTFSRSWPVHANYLPTNITRTQVTGIDGVANSAYAFEATANNANAVGYVLESTVLDTQYTRSLFIKRLTGSGPVYVAPNGWYGWKGDGTETVTGSNKITNGDFASNVTGWTVAGTPDGSNYFSWNAGGYADFASNGGITAVSQGTSGLTPGKIYRLTAVITVASGSVRLSVTGGGSGRVISASGTYHVLAMADAGSSLTAHFSRSSGTLVCTIDDVVVQEVTSINCDVSSQLVLNEWKRVTVPSYVAHGGASARLILIATSGDKIAVDQHQIETGTVATSPIITGSATVTRAADNMSIATSAFPINAAAGTLYAKVILRAPTSIGTNTAVSLNDGTNNEAYRLRVNDGVGAAQFAVTDGGVSQAGPFVAGVTVNTEQRVAGAYALNDFQVARNGSTGTLDTSGTLPTVTTLTIGGAASGGQSLHGHLLQLMYLPRRMSDADLPLIGA